MVKGLPDSLRTTGYDREEEYFFALNQQLIDEQRQMLAADDSASVQNLVCPGCSARLQAVESQGLKGHVCVSCGGVYLAKDALAQFHAAHDGSIREAVKRLFAKATRPLPTGIGQFPV